MNKDKIIKDYISNALKEIQDKSLENMLREMIFSCDMNMQDALKIINKHRPETIKEISL